MTLDRVLVVSRDDRLAAWLLQTVRTAGWVGAGAASTEGALEVAEAGEPGMVLVDVTTCTLHELWVDRINRCGMRTIGVSTRRTDGELEAALSAGADAFVQCPVGSHELVARLRAVARRPAPPRATTLASAIEVGALVVRPADRSVEVADRRLDLSRQELAILERLALVAPVVVHRDELVRALWASEPGGLALDAVVRRLRTRLEAVEGWRRIETVRGVGFRLQLVQPGAVRARGASRSRDGRQPFTVTSPSGHGAFDPAREPSGL